MEEKILGIILKLESEEMKVDFMDEYASGYNDGLSRAVELLWLLDKDIA